MESRSAVRRYALVNGAPVPHPLSARVTTLHEAFDGFPLGVYTAFRTFEGNRFLGLQRHFERMDRCLELVHSDLVLDRASVCEALASLLPSDLGPDVVCRLDVFSEAPEGAPAGSRTWLALAPFHPVPAEFRRRGVGVQLGKLRRRDPRVKEASFVLERRPFPLAERESYEDLLVDDQGGILEGSSSNVYVLVGTRLVTARQEALPGITQSFVLELAQAAGLVPELRPISPEDRGAAQEAFLSSSTRGILPIVQIDGVPVGSGQPGPRTRDLQERYEDLIRTSIRAARDG